MAASGPEDPGTRPAYLHAARFATTAAAHQVYRRIARALSLARCDLSVYNLLIDGAPHLVLLGEAPPAPVAARLAALLAAGTAAEIADDVVALLARRRREQQQRGTSVQGHYRPGKRLR